MLHINLGNDSAVIRSLFEYRPETARPLYNRYVDGLATIRPEGRGEYAASAEVIVNYGYLAGLSAPAQSPLSS